MSYSAHSTHSTHTAVHGAGAGISNSHGVSVSAGAGAGRSRVIDPHIFDKVWHLDGLCIFYTSLARCRDIPSKDIIISNIRSHLEDVTASERWVWIFDGNGVGVKHTVHFPIAVALARMIQAHFSENLQHVYILNPGSAVEGVITQIVPMFSPESLKNMSILKGTLLEVFGKLQLIGWSDPCIRMVMDRIRHH